MGRVSPVRRAEMERHAQEARDARAANEVLLGTRRARLKYVPGEKKHCLHCDKEFAPGACCTPRAHSFSSSVFCAESCQVKFIGKAIGRLYAPRPVKVGIKDFRSAILETRTRENG